MAFRVLSHLVKKEILVGKPSDTWSFRSASTVKPGHLEFREVHVACADALIPTLVRDAWFLSFYLILLLDSSVIGWREGVRCYTLSSPFSLTIGNNINRSE